MKKYTKITLIIFIVLIGLILLDTIQAKIFNNSPILKIREEYNLGSTYYIDKGLLVNHYYCKNKEEKTLFKKDKYSCPIINEDINNNEKPNVEMEKYSKVLDSKLIELDIPKGWNYQELDPSDDYEFALKIYKESNNKGITLLYDYEFFLCGTGLTTESIKLNSGVTAHVGYYKSEDEAWYYIRPIYDSDKKSYVFFNNGLNLDESIEALEFIKTFNITTI